MDSQNQINASYSSQQSAPSRWQEPVEQLEIQDLDDILDDIDAVLEENAQEFVDSFIQKGGQ
ncbi:MAG: ubiquitin-like protein Pup [Actinomyces graevenitzii]|nr:ubiquitin-like protein Pup [Actinomyces graevenitzii]